MNIKHTFIVSVIGLLIGLIFVWNHIPIRSETNPPRKPPSDVATSTVAAVGIIESNSENISIGTSKDGLIETVSVKAGDFVKVGESLFVVDRRTLEAEKIEQEASIMTANAQVKVAEQKYKDADRNLSFMLAVKDKGAIRNEELSSKEMQKAISEAELSHSKALLKEQEAHLNKINTELEKSIVTSPINGVVLESNVRVGEYAKGGSNTLMLLGAIDPLYVRIDVDESEAWRVITHDGGKVLLRGNANQSSPLKFIREEPYIKPKKSLTGGPTERVDTRVLQLIFEITDRNFVGKVGQQVDVFLPSKEVQ